MNRGDRRESIFHDDADRQRFIETLGEACGKTEIGNGSVLTGNGSVLTFETFANNCQEGISPHFFDIPHQSGGRGGHLRRESARGAMYGESSCHQPGGA